LRCDVRQGNMSSQLLGIRNFFFFSVVESASAVVLFASQTPRVHTYVIKSQEILTIF
jgi:hypothetical protein